MPENFEIKDYDSVGKHHEDISHIEKIEIRYLRGASGELAEASSTGGGGWVEDVVADVSDFDDLYIWVADWDQWGRYDGTDGSRNGGGSTEVSVVDEDASDTDTAPFIAGAGGGGGSGTSWVDGGDGARGHDAEGEEPPLGGEGSGVGTPDAGNGAVSGHGSNVPIMESGETDSLPNPQDDDYIGEVRIKYFEDKDSGLLAGETITYDSVGKHEIDIEGIGEIEIHYVYGAGQQDTDFGTENGGAVEDVTADVTDWDNLYVWIAESIYGRYDAEEGRHDGGGSTEVSVVDEDASDTDTAPFIAGAGGAGGRGDQYGDGGDGARGGDAQGVAPPEGGDGGTEEDNSQYPGDGAVSGHGSAVPILDSGDTIEGGGNSDGEPGEVKIEYFDAVSGVNNITIDDEEVEGITIDGEEVVEVTIDGEVVFD